MELPQFGQSETCRLRIHCRTCRSTEHGAAFRKSMAQRFSGIGEGIDCPHGLPWGFKGAPPVVPERSLWSEAGPKLWKELHLHCMFTSLVVPETEVRWLAQFAASIPCGDCRAHWIQLVEAHPPSFTSNAGYFLWSFERHNDVNRKLGKPIMALKSAATFWEAHRREFFGG